MRKLFVASFLAAVGYAAMTAYDTAAGAFKAVISATHDRSAIADSLK